jgi:hypothetical protein
VDHTAVEESLRRLDIDDIHLHQIHHFDPATDLEETLSALTDLITAGEIRAIGSPGFHGSDILQPGCVQCPGHGALLRSCRAPRSHTWQQVSGEHDHLRLGWLELLDVRLVP